MELLGEPTPNHKKRIPQVLSRTNGAHRFMENLIKKFHLEERQSGIVDRVLIYKICVIKIWLE